MDDYMLNDEETFFDTPYPVLSWELVEIGQAWYALAAEHGVKQYRVMLTHEDIVKLAGVYYYWKQLLVPDQRPSLADVHDYIYCLHFNVIIEMYLARRYGHLFGIDAEDMFQW